MEIRALSDGRIVHAPRNSHRNTIIAHCRIHTRKHLRRKNFLAHSLLLTNVRAFKGITHFFFFGASCLHFISGYVSYLGVKWQSCSAKRLSGNWAFRGALRDESEWGRMLRLRVCFKVSLKIRTLATLQKRANFIDLKKAYDRVTTCLITLITYFI